MADLRGEDFRALRRLSTRDNLTLANVGDSCARVPVASLPALLASGKIVPFNRSTDATLDDASHNDE